MGCRLSDTTRCNSPDRGNLRNASNYFVNEAARVFPSLYVICSRILVGKKASALELGLTDSHNTIFIQLKHGSHRAVVACINKDEIGISDDK